MCDVINDVERHHSVIFHLVLVPFVSLHQRYGTPYLLTFCNLKLLILLDVI